MTELEKNGIALNDSDLEQVSGGKNLAKRPDRKGKCPHCGKQTLVIKYKRLECQNCGYVEPM